MYNSYRYKIPMGQLSFIKCITNEFYLLNNKRKIMSIVIVLMLKSK